MKTIYKFIIFLIIAFECCINNYIIKAQCDAGPDITICSGNSTQLNATGGLIYSWSPPASLSDTGIYNPIASPSVTTTYYLNSLAIAGELITNGNFELGNTGFTTQYTYNPTSLAVEGTYTVGNSPFAVHPSWEPCGDHTTGSGKMMILNGAPSAINVWTTSVSVTPGTNYAFSAWLTGVYESDPNLAILQFSINGNVLGSPETALATACTWKLFYIFWNSGVNTTANISILNQNTATGGNDFAIDDISFAPVVPNCVDSVVVTVAKATVDAGADVSICKNDIANLTATGGATYQWNTGKTTSGISVSPSVKTTYIVTGTDANGCTDRDSVVVNINPSANADFTGDTLNGCENLMVNFTDNTIGSIQSWLWNFGDGTTSTQQNPPHSFSEGIYDISLVVTTIDDCKDTLLMSDLVEAYKQPVANFTPDPEVATMQQPVISFINNSQKSDHYLWEFGDGSTSSEQNPSHTYANEGLYHVCLYTFTDDSCSDSYCYDIRIIEDSLSISNVYTPNGDGVNDYFEIKNIEKYIGSHITIFNRWGKKIYEADNYNNSTVRWDGKKDTEGVYYYILNYHGYLKDGEISGTVTVIR